MLQLWYDPSGLQHPVGERGSALSGGQRQRDVARFFKIHLLVLMKPPALDYPERRVCLNLAQAFHRLLITHRLATIKHADVIQMMEQGTVLGGRAGTYGLRGRYYCLYQQQEIL